MLADSSEVDSARLLATRTNARTRTTSRLPTRLVWVSRMTRRWLLDSVGGGSRSDLRAVAARSLGAAQRELHALGNGGEIALAVERRKNGAAHESRAAQTGQDCAAEPLHRHAAAIDEIVRSRRRPTAAAHGRGRCDRPRHSSGMRRAVCRDPKPTPPLAPAGGLPQHGLGVPKTRPTTGLRPRTRRHDAEVRAVRQRTGPCRPRLCREAPSGRCALRPWCRIPRTDTSRQRKVGSRNVAQVRPLVRPARRCPGSGRALRAARSAMPISASWLARMRASAALRKCANLLA